MMKKIDVKFRNPYNNCILSKIIFHQYLPKFIRTFDLMGSQTDRFRYEVFQNLILRPMNTGLLRPAVATVPTVYGIETGRSKNLTRRSTFLLQQYLPFTVLKPINFHHQAYEITLQQYLPFTVCAEGCETTEEQSDDEVRTSQVPERSEGKTEVMR